MIHHMCSSENEVPWNPMVCDIIFSFQWTILGFFMWEKQCHKPLDHPPSSPQSPFLFIGGIVWLNRWPFPVMAGWKMFMANFTPIFRHQSMAPCRTPAPTRPGPSWARPRSPCDSPGPAESEALLFRPEGRGWKWNGNLEERCVMIVLNEY